MARTLDRESEAIVRVVSVPSGHVTLSGELNAPAGAHDVVLFAHGSGSSRFSPRNQYVARRIREEGVGTLLFDLLTPDEETIDARTTHLRFNFEMLGHRLVDAARSVTKDPETSNVALGLFGSSTGAAAALNAAAALGDRVSAVVSRRGRPDLGGAALPRVKAPTLLIVGARDELVLSLNQAAWQLMRCARRLEIVPRATHLFSEPGALEEVARLAAEWFSHYRDAIVSGAS
jgi:pimeloyl-ACP methyl ester carboxylesterase